MVALNRTITTLNNAHQLQPHLTQHITKQHTQNKTTLKITLNENKTVKCNTK